MLIRTTVVAAGALFVALGNAIADDWPGPTVQAVASRNAEVIVRVIPGASFGDTVGFAGASKGKFASAQWLRFRDDRYEPYQTAQLLNPVAPIQVAVANDGTLVTLDNWHNVGFGEIVVIYSPDGKVRKSYRLADLYSTATIEKIERSVSSLWWRCMRGDPRVQPNGTLQVDDTLGGRFTFRLDDGAHTYEAGAGRCETREAK